MSSALRITLYLAGIAFLAVACLLIWTGLYLLDNCYLHLWSRFSPSTSFFIVEDMTVNGQSVEPWKIILGNLVAGFLLGPAGYALFRKAGQLSDSREQ